MRPDYSYFARTYRETRNVRRNRGAPLLAVLLSAAAVAAVTFYTARSAMAFETAELTLFTFNVSLKSAEGTVTAHETSAQSVGEFLAQNGIVPKPGQAVFPDLDAAVYEGMTIELLPAKSINVVYAGRSLSVFLARGTVKDALEAAGIVYNPADEVAPQVYVPISDGMTITYNVITHISEIEREILPFSTVYIDDDTLEKGKTREKTAGINGEYISVYDVLQKNGLPQSRTLIATSTNLPVNREILRGTKQIKRVSAPAQKTLKADTRKSNEPPLESEVKKVITVEATAYTHTGNKTATGTTPKVGTIAVNPELIPYGSKLYVEGYGYGTAEDTGGFRHTGEARVDLFMNTYKECIAWGRRSVKLYVLKKG